MANAKRKSSFEIGLDRSIAKGIVDNITLILDEGYAMDKVLKRLFSVNTTWKGRQKAVVANYTIEIVRYYRKYEALAGKQLTAHPLKWWHILGVHFYLDSGALPDWKEFSLVAPDSIEERIVRFQKIRAVDQSIPDWMDEIGVEELGEENWTALLPLLNEKSEIVLRANTLKISMEDLITQLKTDGIDTEVLEGGALMLRQWKNVYALSAFKEGLFEVQDGASQMVAPFLEPEPGMQVVDACAGAGGKTLHLAALMQNKGRIVALDNMSYKLNELSKRAKRAGAFNIETRLVENNKVIKRLEKSADRVLLDVPCSGLGVLKRNPDIKWRLQSDFKNELLPIQADLLVKYSTMLRRGGKMVYATCSVFPSENEKQVEMFLQKTEGKFKLNAMKNIMPSAGFDGFFMASLESK